MVATKGGLTYADLVEMPMSRFLRLCEEVPRALRAMGLVE